ncbi:hypothetical protein [Peribacillus butanolivorans]|uniref:hypothetical protein n=1 Tax=Peribacillus butanolivorans TaxID=421767 RepID=UPI00365DA456
MGHIFWMIYLGILGTAAIGFLIKGAYKTSLAKMDFVISIITWIGLFGYITKTSILTPLVWKFVFVGSLLWDIIFSFMIKDYNSDKKAEELPDSISKLLTGITLVVCLGPLYYGLFKYAF